MNRFNKMSCRWLLCFACASILGSLAIPGEANAQVRVPYNLNGTWAMQGGGFDGWTLTITQYQDGSLICRPNDPKILKYWNIGWGRVQLNHPQYGPWMAKLWMTGGTQVPHHHVSGLIVNNNRIHFAGNIAWVRIQ